MLAAVGRLIDATFMVGPIRMSQSAHVNDIRRIGINNDSADLTRVFQTHVLPSPARINGPVDAISGGERGPNVRFAGSDVNNLGIRWRQSNGTNRSEGCAVRNRLPDHAGVRGLPDSPVHA